MKKILSKNGETLAIVTNFDDHDTTAFLTDSQNEMQLGVGVLEAGHQFIPHMHKDVSRELTKTSEFIFVLHGALSIDVLDIDESVVETVVLNSNCALLQFFGGHDIRSDAQTKYFELKQGPYLGKDADKYELTKS
ncbi:MAG: hypothetical protein COA42_00435 [Alteromonadaceae bacterium]|nr:MAG: hypothetical protein COA42_00435 [Alteromonadaceae bacterium]